MGIGLQGNSRASRQTHQVVLFGLGGVGSALLRQLLAQRAALARGFGVSLGVLAVADSSGLLAPSAGAELLGDAPLQAALAAKQGGGKLAALNGAQHVKAPENALRLLSNRLTPQTIVVDCTATDATVPALLLAREAGCKLVLANKKPLTGAQEVYDRLTRAGGTGGATAAATAATAATATAGAAVSDAATVTLGALPVESAGPPAHAAVAPAAALDWRRVRWETTCGAGLPVMVTLNRLQMCGDPVRRIAGALSGTLGYVMTGLQEGRPLSDVVREAHRLGYTEPDPRDDLGGMDVARKALILARGLGWPLDLGDVEVTSLYPLHMDRMTVAEFLAALPQLDGYFAEQVAAAASQGGVLRYAAVVADGRCSVGPTVVPADSPLGRLAGADNLIEFHTGWYAPTPLVIQGRGAGADATAAGVLSDIVELALLD